MPLVQVRIARNASGLWPHPVLAQLILLFFEIEIPTTLDVPNGSPADL